MTLIAQFALTTGTVYYPTLILVLPGYWPCIFCVFHPDPLFGDDAFECRACCALLHDGAHDAGRQLGRCCGIQHN